MSARGRDPKPGSVVTGPESVATQRGIGLGGGPDIIADICAELDAADLVNAEEIGRGGFGVVYRCVQRALDRTVAVKVLTADLDDANRERFLREEHAMGRLSGHPNIVDILYVDITSSGRPYIVMPYHARGCLDSLVRDEGPLPWTDAVRIGVKVSGAMEWAHRAGILHRDVKPANILLNAFDEPQLTDFGIARVSGGFETSTNVIVGSPAFTAPEILSGGLPSAQSDVYGLGATLFCLLTGHAAYERRSGEKVVAQFLRIASAPIPDLRALDIPPDVAGAVEAAMATDPDDRPVSAEEFGRSLQTIEDRHGLLRDEMKLPATAGRVPTTVPRSPTVVRSRVHIAEPDSAEVDVVAARADSPAPQWLERPRLIDALRAGGGSRITFVHAPAGFGKSTLLAQWRRALLDAGSLVVELTVDHHDNDVVWFFTRVVDAIRRVQPDLGVGLVDHLEAREGDGATSAFGQLVDEIHATGVPLALLIDDWNKITDEATLGAVAKVLQRGCRHVRLLFASRTALPFARLALGNDLIEIDSEALRFDLREVAAFFRELHGIELAETDVAQLCEATSGWPAAVNLVALALGGGGETAVAATPRSTSRSASRAAKAIARLEGDQLAVTRYLGANVLHTLQHRMIDLLMAACIAERICGDLAAAMTLDPDSETLLADAERRGLFLHGDPDDPGWFRFDSLIAEFLRERLGKDHTRARLLRVRASRWFAANGRVREAVDLSLAADDVNVAIDLVESRAMDMVDDARLATLHALVAKLPPALVESSPELLLAIMRADVTHRRPTARPMLERIDSALASGSSEEPGHELRRLEADVLRALDSTTVDITSGVEDLVAAALARPETVPAWVATSAANVASFVAWTRFDFDRVRRIQDWASDFHDRSRDPLGRVYGNCYAGIVAREQLDIYSAAAQFGRALEFAEHVNGRQSHGARIASALLGQLYYDQGDLETAERLLGDAYELGADIGGVDFLIPIFVTGARIMALRGDRGGALVRLEEGTAAAVRLDVPRLAAHVEAERSRWGYGASDRFVDVASTAVGGFAAGFADVVEEAAVRAALDSSRHDLSYDFITRAQALSVRADDRGCALSLVRCQLLLACCLRAGDRSAEGKEAMVPAVARCSDLGLDRVVLDAGTHAVELLSELRADQQNGRWRADWPMIPDTFFAELMG
jgi:serine/threonine-protein kinase PknK